MSDQPKKTLSAEQLAKMQEGRKKAYEARKRAREEEKLAKQAAKAAAKKEQEEAIRQQKEQRELIQKANEDKSKKKAELKALKEQPPEPTLSKEELVEMGGRVDDIEEEEVDDERYKKVFEDASLKVLETLPNNAKDLFKKANSKFDCKLSVEDNIKSMIEYCRELVKANIETAKVVKSKVVEEKPVADKPVDIVIPPKEQIAAEREIEQRIYAIMKKFK